MAKSIKIDDALDDRVQTLADQRRRSPQWIVQEAVREYIEREEVRENLKRDGLHAWEKYQQTGLHVTLAEADDWLAQLESGKDVEPPKCHV